jgi:hypothetical protein
MDSTIADFFARVYEAHSASEEVDSFDLNSGDPESQATFDELIRLQKDQSTALVQFVMAHANELMTKLKAL